MPGRWCLHTIIQHPSDAGGIFVGISAAGVFRTDDAGKTWRPTNRGLHSEQIPDATAEVGHCVHNLAMHPSRPDVLFMQKHWDVMRSDDATLPTHLRTLAHVNGEVELHLEGQATQRAVLDALEERYPMLRGTIRDHVTGQRRCGVRPGRQRLAHRAPTSRHVRGTATPGLP